MFIIYDLIFLLVAVFALPVYLIRRKFHPGFRCRLGFLPTYLELHRPIWIHAVSVGEVMAVRGLIEELRGLYPKKRFVISTVTSTGNKIARKIARDTDFITYLPLDFSFIVGRVLRKIKPCMLVLAETEIWPNLITLTAKNNIPVIVVNGRISDASLRGYLTVRLFIKPILNRVSLFCVQSERDAQRLLRLGVAGDKVVVTGNMKFDIIKGYTDTKNHYTDLKKKLGLGLGDRLLLAGSTHPKEEEIILWAYKRLLGDFLNLKLLIAPRHPERALAIEKIAAGFGFNVSFISDLDTKPQATNLSVVFILDTIGQLIHYYAVADIVFVGGSLVKKGGHNILEPLAEARPVLFGPHMFNFRDIADLFLNHNASILVHNKEELYANIKELLCNPQKMEALGTMGRSLLLKNQGATKKTAKEIKDLCGNISIV